jgi:arylformamidase
MLAARGIACAVPDYRLAPAASITDIIGDCRRAIAYLWHNAESLGIDRSRIVVTGSSAGGHLAAAMAQPGWQASLGLPDQPLHGCLPVSGLFELAPLAASHVQDWMQFTADELAQSPMRHPPEGLRGALALAAGAGESAGFHRQSAAYAKATGWPVIEVAERNHFDVILDLAQPETPCRAPFWTFWLKPPDRAGCGLRRNRQGFQTPGTPSPLAWRRWLNRDAAASPDCRPPAVLG